MSRPLPKANPGPTTASGTVTPRPPLTAWLTALSLALVTIGLYWPAVSYPFLNYDDDVYVVHNRHVAGGLTLEGALWAFRSGYASNWHPVTWLSHMVDCQAFGLNPWGHHLVSVLLHGLNAGLVFLLLQRLTGARWRSLVVAALFAAHPLRVESVAWVAERKDVLIPFFGLLCLWGYVRYVEEAKKSKVLSLKSKVQEQSGVSSLKSKVEAGAAVHAPRTAHHVSRFTFHASRSTLHAPRFYALSLLFFALGLMSKPMLVTWPFVMLLLDYWPLNRSGECGVRNAEFASDRTSCPDPHSAFRTPHSAAHAPRSTLHAPRFTFHVSLRLLAEKIPFLGLAVAASIVTLVAQKQGGAVEAAGRIPFGARSGNALISCGRYLEKLFWPADLAVFYPHPGHWPLASVLLAGGLILGVSAVLCLRRRRFPYCLIGWLWFVGTAVPVLGLVQVGGQAMADRYTYIPSLGVLILIVWGAYELTRRWRYAEAALSVTALGAIVLCFGLTREQLGYWRSNEALFRHAIAVTSDNWMAHNNLGTTLDREGRVDEAICEYRESIRLKPDMADAYYNLGSALGNRGRTDEAISQFRQAIRLKPEKAQAHYNLGIALGLKGQTDEAISEFEETVRLKPDNADAHKNLGVALGRKGHTDEAIHHFEEAIRLKPDKADAHNNLGIALLVKGQIDGAISQFQDAIRLEPGSADARNNLARALRMKNTSARQ